MQLTIQQLEQAINFWRQQHPATGEEQALSPEAAALATPYAIMIYAHRQSIPLDLLEPAARAAWDEYQRLTGIR
jgi:hypothetical protein